MEQIRTFMSSRTTKGKEEPWMASESFLGRFSEKTDMWSYGGNIYALQVSTVQGDGRSGDHSGCY